MSDKPTTYLTILRKNAMFSFLGLMRAEELVNTVARLAAKYQDDKAEGGRSFRFLLAGFPVITKPDATADAAVRME